MVQGEKKPVGASAMRVSEVRFLTAKGEIMSSPARTTVREEEETARPTEGRRRGWEEEGSWVARWERGLKRKRDLGPGGLERKRRRPLEEEEGVEEEGMKGGRGSWCHWLEGGEKRRREEEEEEEKRKEGWRWEGRWWWRWRKESEKRRE